AAHFHGPAGPEETAPPVIDISADLMVGSADITPEQMQMIQDGMTYINIHTEANPDGVIRGQVTAAE
ncbi:MAG TPA: CHRD domain-containing protein, partial [Rubellimicrobium sp.]|nr:CHRD domain-containing protein [Rubellimicrobium sp.]